MNFFRAYRYILAGDAVIQSDADENTIANIVISFAAAKIQMTHDRVETSTAMFQPYFDDLDIHFQRHRYIDGPLIREAMDALVTANNLLNIARFRLTSIRAGMAPGLAWDLHDVLNLSLGLQVLLHRAEAKNRDILHLFHSVTGQNTPLTPLDPNTWGNRDFSPA